MVNISKDNNISMTRGDSWSVPLFLNKGTALTPLRRILSSRDAVYFAIMEPNQPFENAIVKKKFTNKDVNKNKDVVVKITPEDTSLLRPGKYYYQIKAKFINIYQTMNTDIEIVNDTILKAGTVLTLGSTINGINVTPSTENSKTFVLENDTQLSIGDIIKEGSDIKAGSTLNNELIEETEDVNTVVQKREFVIYE